MIIKAIDTKYKGYNFRSRLEARWAIFFDSLGIKWEYEKEGYNLGNGIYYLPDFWLPQLDCFIEIKPIKASEEELKKAELLCAGTKKTVHIFDKGFPDKQEDFNEGDFSQSFFYVQECAGMDYNYLFCECPHCGKIGIQYDGRADRIDCNCKRSSHGDKGYNNYSKKIKQAFNNAKSARFENL